MKQNFIQTKQNFIQVKQKFRRNIMKQYHIKNYLSYGTKFYTNRTKNYTSATKFTHKKYNVTSHSYYPNNQNNIISRIYIRCFMI